MVREQLSIKVYFLCTSCDSAADAVGAPRSDVMMRLQPSRTHVMSQSHTSTLLGLCSPMCTHTAGVMQRPAMRPSHALQASRSGPPCAHPMHFMLSACQYPYITFVDVQQCPHVVFVSVQLCPHVAFVGIGPIHTLPVFVSGAAPMSSAPEARVFVNPLRYFGSVTRPMRDSRVMLVTGTYRVTLPKYRSGFTNTRPSGALDMGATPETKTGDVWMGPMPTKAMPLRDARSVLQWFCIPFGVDLTYYDYVEHWTFQHQIKEVGWDSTSFSGHATFYFSKFAVFIASRLNFLNNPARIPLILGSDSRGLCQDCSYDAWKFFRRKVFVIVAPITSHIHIRPYSAPENFRATIAVRTHGESTQTSCLLFLVMIPSSARGSGGTVFRFWLRRFEVVGFCYFCDSAVRETLRETLHLYSNRKDEHRSQPWSKRLVLSYLIERMSIDLVGSLVRREHIPQPWSKQLRDVTHDRETNKEGVTDHRVDRELDLSKTYYNPSEAK
ncbi:hypothetical protein FB451DRAFT_1379918 [Mycena latifolia]|nr:hypothetical protein FB451DRAFT_1379918 [Mycena latifolia]